MKQNFRFKVNPSSGRQYSPSTTGSDGKTQWELSFLKERKKKTSRKSIFLIGPLEEKRVRAEIHHADCWPCLRGATWGWCCVGFVRVLVVLDSVHVSWISGGKPSHCREQLITSVSHQPHCLRRDDKWAGPHVWLWQPRGTRSSWRGAQTAGRPRKKPPHFREPVRAFWEFKRTLQWLYGRSSVATMLGMGVDGLT